MCSEQTVDQLIRQMNPEVWIVTAADGEDRGGLIATFVASASIVPACPRMLVGLAKQHRTWEIVEAAGAFALHLIDESQLDWVRRFGMQSGRDGIDKFAGLEVDTGITGSPLLRDALGWLDCRVETRMETGDRTVYLAEIVEGHLARDGTPLRQQRLLQLAPAEMRAHLKEQLERDRLVDQQAIEMWREAQRRESQS